MATQKQMLILGTTTDKAILMLMTPDGQQTGLRQPLPTELQDDQCSPLIRNRNHHQSRNHEDLNQMKNYEEFHDGSFEGLWIDGKTVHVFLATEGRERFTVVAQGVAALTIEGVKAGNILFEVLERGSEEVLPQDIQSLYALQEGSAGESQGANLLEKARLQGWRILEVNPSYGASCLVLAGSLDIFRREDWLERYVLSLTR